MSKLEICPECVAKIEVEKITIFGDVIDGLKDVIASADPRKVAGLRETIDLFLGIVPRTTIGPSAVGHLRCSTT